MSLFDFYTETKIIQIISEKEKLDKKTSEFEIRFRGLNDGQNISDELFDNLMNHEEWFKKGSKTKETILSHIPNKKEQYRTRHINNGNGTQKNSIIKTQISNCILPEFNVKISLSSEIETNKKISNENGVKFVYRFIKRTSMISNDGNWRFDFSKVCELNDIFDDDTISLNAWYKKCKKLDKYDRNELELEYVGNSPANKMFVELTEILSLLLPIFEIENKKLKEFVKLPLNKLPTINVYPLDNNKINFILNQNGHWFVSNKIDGERVLVQIKNKDGKIQVNIKDYYTKKQIRDPFYITGFSTGLLPIVIEAEITKKLNTEISFADIVKKTNTIAGGKNVGDYNYSDIEFIVCYDLLAFSGIGGLDKPYGARYTKLCEIMSKISLPLSKNNDYDIFAKKLYKLGENIKITKEMKTTFVSPIDILLNSKNKYLTDGLIISSCNDFYKTRNNFKWKPKILTSIDLLVKIRNVDEKEKMIYLDLYAGCSTEHQKISYLVKSPNHKITKFDKNYRKYFGNLYKWAYYFPIVVNEVITENAEPLKMEYTEIIRENILNFNGIYTENKKYILKIGGAKIYNDCIAEFIYKNDEDNIWNFDKSISSWHVLRIRDDKTYRYKIGDAQFGNNIKVVVDNWNIIKSNEEFEIEKIHSTLNTQMQNNPSNLPQNPNNLPQNNRPNFPQNNGPQNPNNLSQNNRPNLPQNNGPQNQNNFPQNNGPQNPNNLPQNNRPNLPQNNRPNFPQNNGPQNLNNLPQNNRPNFPQNNRPNLPQIRDICEVEKLNNIISEHLCEYCNPNTNYLLELGYKSSFYLKNWNAAGIKNATIIENQDLDQSKYSKFRGKVITINGNVKKDRLSVILKDSYFNTKLKDSFDIISIQHSLCHYCEEPTILTKLFGDISTMLRTDGILILNGMDGNKLFDLLNGTDFGQQYKLGYCNITKLYKEKNIKKAGQKIILDTDPITKEKRNITTNLINFDSILEILTGSEKFTIIEDCNYTTALSHCNITLNPEEIDVCNIYRFMVLKRNVSTIAKQSRKKLEYRDETNVIKSIV